MHASRMMFHAPFPLILFETGTRLSAGTLEESEKFIKPCGALGVYLYHYRLKSTCYRSPEKGYFDFGEIAVIIDPGLGKWEEVQCPIVTPFWGNLIVLFLRLNMMINYSGSVGL